MHELGGGPEPLVGHDRRWPRIEVALEVHLRAANLVGLAHAYTANISCQGVFIITDSPRPIGTSVKITIAIETSARPQQVQGVVVHVSPEGEIQGMGIFIPSPPPEWQRLCEALERARASVRDFEGEDTPTQFLPVRERARRRP